MAMLSCLFLQLSNSSAQGNAQSVSRNPPAANQRPVTSPAKGPRPKRDPADQLFRSAPMAGSSRSIAISLATNLHVAFDSRLLRTHTAWAGEALNLFGSPHHGGKSPFLATYEGAPLWTMPPFCPWSVKVLSTNEQLELPAGSRFDGISTTDGAATLLYGIAVGEGHNVPIKETPSRLALREANGVLRRFEIAPSTVDLWFLAHAEMGRITASDTRTSSMVAVERTNDVLVAAAHGWTNVQWQTIEREVSYEVRLNVEGKDGESDFETVRVVGHQARAYLHIPAHSEAVTVEIISAVCRNLDDAARLSEELRTRFSTRATQGPTDIQRKGSPSRAPETFSADNSAPARMSGDDYFRIEHFPVPKEIGLLVTGMDWLPNGDLAICTWSGEIYIVEKAQGPVAAARYRRFARGLNEPLGIKVIRDQIYVVQKSELTRILDTDRNGEADLFQTINSDWGYSGNYHAFAFGPVADKKNNFYAFLCGQRGRWDIPYVGWCVQINSESRKLEGFCSGLRAPNGVGTYGPDDDLFIADNQGNWIGACKLNHLQRGKFYGFPSGFPAPEADYKQPKAYEPPAVWFPRKLSPSTSGFVTINDERFGPFKGQMVIGDFQNAVALRVFLEKVNGQWQGAVWPFAKGFLSGVNRLAMGPDGKLYVGGLKNSAWSAAAPKEYSLDRVSFSGKLPFEIKEVHATTSGFELIFTETVDKASASNPDNYDVAQFSYLYHQAYGSPEIDHDGKKDSSTPIKVTSALVSEDRLRVQLTLAGWRTGHVTMVRALDVNSAAGSSLWHDTFYYTLNNVPK